MTPQPPSIWQEWLFENPWPLGITLVGLAVVLRLIASRGGGKLVVRFWWLPLLLAVGVYGLTRVVETGREQLLDRARELAAVTGPVDVARVRAMFEPDAVLVGPDGQVWLELSSILGELEAAAQRFAIEQQTIRGLAAEARSDEQGLVLLDLRTRMGAGLGAQTPIPTRWLLTWRRSPADGQWRIHRVQWLELMNQPPPFGVWR